MAQFDVFRVPDGTLLLDCQSEAMEYLETRLVAPLIALADAPPRRPHLNPIFDLNGQTYVMLTQFAAAVSSGELRVRVAHLDRHRFEIIGAFDMLLTGV